MFAQVMEGLQVKADGTYLDGTFGRGGHARGVLQRLGPGGRLLLMDKDPEAIAVAGREFGGDARVAIFRGSFADLAHWDATAAGLDGVLLDLGVSSPQLDVAERGFSFGRDGPLDMRMDPDSGESAAQWLASASEKEIADVLWTWGEERMSRPGKPVIGPSLTLRLTQSSSTGIDQEAMPSSFWMPGSRASACRMAMKPRGSLVGSEDTMAVTAEAATSTTWPGGSGVSRRSQAATSVGARDAG